MKTLTSKNKYSGQNGQQMEKRMPSNQLEWIFYFIFKKPYNLTSCHKSKVSHLVILHTTESKPQRLGGLQETPVEQQAPGD